MIAVDEMDDTDSSRMGINGFVQDADTDVEAVTRIHQTHPPLVSEGNGGLGIDEAITIAKQRTPVPKLDQERLLSPAGIPKLRRIPRERLRFRKGHEYSDANRLLNMYQLWLDDLYPRAKFADGLAIIEKLGHNKRVQVMRRQWLSEGKLNSSPIHPDAPPYDAILEPSADSQQPFEVFAHTVKSQGDTNTITIEEPAYSDTVQRISSVEKHETIAILTAERLALSRRQRDRQDDGDDLDALLAEQQTDHQWSSINKDDRFMDEMEVMREFDAW